MAVENSRGVRALAAALLLLALPSTSRAVEVGDGKLSVNGYGGWAFGSTFGGNPYSLGTPDGSYDNTRLALALGARPSEHLAVHLQLSMDGSLAGLGVGFDWGFAEWKFTDGLRLRAGKVKLPFGLVMETVNVGTLRPFYSAPTGIYGHGNIGATAYQGAGVASVLVEGVDWELDGDLYGGMLETDLDEPLPVAVESTPTVSRTVRSHLLIRDALGGRLSLTNPSAGLTFMLSGYGGRLEEFSSETSAFERFRVFTGGLSAQYLSDAWLLRSEAFGTDEFDGEGEANVSCYGEVARRFLTAWQAAVRGEYFETILHGQTPSLPAFFRHQEVALALSRWFSAGFVVRVEYHVVHGNRFARPNELASDAVSRVPGWTHLALAGAQFSF